jgi:molybdopterin-guanine dinucleotide biosynthesis protein A
LFGSFRQTNVSSDSSQFFIGIVAGVTEDGRHKGMNKVLNKIMNKVLNKGAIILCGGKSSRMGRDKATLPFGPELMLQRVVRIVSQVVDPASVVIVAAADQALPELPSTVLRAEDERPGRGPLEGLAAGFRAMPDGVDAVYATSCDVPLIVPGFITALFDRLGTFDVAVPTDGRYLHPLAAVYRPRVLSIIESLLAGDRLRPAFLFDEAPTALIHVDQLRDVDPNLETLQNLNHPDDYLAALKRAGFASG